MNRAEYYQRRSTARHAIRCRDLLPRDPYTTWQDRERAQQWVQACVARLPGYAYARPYGFIDRQTRMMLCAEFPRWTMRRTDLWHKRQREAMRARIAALVEPLGPSVLEQNMAAAEARRVA